MSDIEYPLVHVPLDCCGGLGVTEHLLLEKVMELDMENVRLRAMIEDGAVVADEVPSASNSVQQHVEAVIDDLVKGRTTKPQEQALDRALGDRRLGRALGKL